MTLVRSAHTFKWGYEGQYVNFDLIRGNGARSATFTGTRSGNPMADFMLGAFDNVSHGFGAADSFPLLWKHQFFIQDEWKLTPRITMNAGLRYEPWFPWEQEYGRYTSWEYGTQSTVKPDAPRGILFPGDPNVPFKTVEGDCNNFAPRLGVAWDVNGNGRTVVRGGYGIYYNHISGTSVHAAEAPWTGTVQLFNGRIEDPFGSLNRPVPPSGVPISGEFGCVPISAYPGLNCPLYPLPLNFVYNDLEMATPYVHHVERLVPAAAHERFHGRRRVCRQVRLQAGRPSAFQPGAVHQLAENRAGAFGAERPRARDLRARHHRSDLARARDAVSELVQRPGTEGDQAHEPRVHVLDLLHALEGASTRCSIRARG